MQDEKVYIEITKAVYDANGKLSGTVLMDFPEADRLVNLNAAKFINAHQGTHLQTAAQREGVLGSTIKSQTGNTSGKLLSVNNVNGEPLISWKKERICRYLKEKNIPFNSNSAKDVLIKVYQRWKDGSN